jgi:hypothetical protein
MFGGKGAAVKFRAKKYIIKDILDWFGRDVRFMNETEGMGETTAAAPSVGGVSSLRSAGRPVE